MLCASERIERSRPVPSGSEAGMPGAEPAAVQKRKSETGEPDQLWPGYSFEEALRALRSASRRSCHDGFSGAGFRSQLP